VGLPGVSGPPTGNAMVGLARRIAKHVRSGLDPAGSPLGRWNRKFLDDSEVVPLEQHLANFMRKA